MGLKNVKKYIYIYSFSAFLCLCAFCEKVRLDDLNASGRAVTISDCHYTIIMAKRIHNIIVIQNVEKKSKIELSVKFIFFTLFMALLQYIVYCILLSPL